MAPSLPLHGVSRLPFDGYLGDGTDTADLLERMLDDPSSGLDPPAAVMLETVQGEGGLNVASPDWLRRVAALDPALRCAADRRRRPGGVRAHGHLLQLRGRRARARPGRAVEVDLGLRAAHGAAADPARARRVAPGRAQRHVPRERPRLRHRPRGAGEVLGLGRASPTSVAARSVAASRTASAPSPTTPPRHAGQGPRDDAGHRPRLDRLGGGRHAAVLRGAPDHRDLRPARRGRQGDGAPDHTRRRARAGPGHPRRRRRSVTSANVRCSRVPSPRRRARSASRRVRRLLASAASARCSSERDGTAAGPAGTGSTTCSRSAATRCAPPGARASSPSTRGTSGSPTAISTCAPTRWRACSRRAACGPDDRVGLLFDGSADSYASILAVSKLDAAYVPLDAGFPEDRLAFIVEDAAIGARGDALAPRDARGVDRHADRVPRQRGRRDRRAERPTGPCPRTTETADDRALLHHLHLRLDGQAEGRGDGPRRHLQLRPGRCARPTACSPAIASTRA